MELRAFGCVVLAYVSVYALFWLFDNHDTLVKSKAPSSFKAYITCCARRVGSYFLGLVTFAARSFGVKGQEVDHFPPPLQIWLAVAALAIVGFFFSNVQCEESFHLLYWEHVGLLTVVVLFPLANVARRRFAKQP